MTKSRKRMHCDLLRAVASLRQRDSDLNQAKDPETRPRQSQSWLIQHHQPRQAPELLPCYEEEAASQAVGLRGVQGVGGWDVNHSIWCPLPLQSVLPNLVVKSQVWG